MADERRRRDRERKKIAYYENRQYHLDRKRTYYYNKKLEKMLKEHIAFHGSTVIGNIAD